MRLLPVFITGITRLEVIAPPRNELRSIKSVLSPNLPLMYAAAQPAVPPPIITISYIFFINTPYAPLV